MFFPTVCLERTWNDLNGTPEDAPAEERRARRAKRVSRADMTKSEAEGCGWGNGQWWSETGKAATKPPTFPEAIGRAKAKAKVIEAGIEPATACV